MRSRWRDDRDLELYDAVFARRIAWKWNAVLSELRGRGWRPPPGELLDWGAGTAIASRTLLAEFDAGDVSSVRLFDRCARAMDFAARRLREEHPGVEVTVEASNPRTAPALLLVSHVANELSPAQLRALVDLARSSACVLWVEPGERETSLLLSKVRDELRDDFRVLAPCSHRASCGALSSERDWCHFFANPPGEVFRDRGWSLVARRLRIDLRALPYSYLLLDGRPSENDAPLRATEPELSRLLGRPRVTKADARWFACDANGVRERKMRKRDAPELHRAIRDGIDPKGVHRIRERDGRMVAIEKAELPLGGRP